MLGDLPRHVKANIDLWIYWTLELERPRFKSSLSFLSVFLFPPLENEDKIYVTSRIL